jgi:hypothetical protein
VKVIQKPGPDFRLILLIALCLVWLSACGEDDKKTSGNGGNAPSTLTGQTYNLTSADTTSIAFASSGNTYILTQPGSRTDTGIYTPTRSGDTWKVTMTSSTAGGGQSQLDMTFSGDGVGTFTFTEANSTTPVTGQFQRSASTASKAKAIDALKQKRVALKSDFHETTRFPNAPKGARGNLKTGTPVGAFAFAESV